MGKNDDNPSDLGETCTAVMFHDIPLYPINNITWFSIVSHEWYSIIEYLHDVFIDMIYNIH